MNPVTTESFVQNTRGCSRRPARRFCEARMQHVRQEIQYHWHFLDAVGGCIEPVQASAPRDDEVDYHHRMFENLVAATWVGTLITTAYFVFQ